MMIIRHCLAQCSSACHSSILGKLRRQSTPPPPRAATTLNLTLHPFRPLPLSPILSPSRRHDAATDSGSFGLAEWQAIRPQGRQSFLCDSSATRRGRAHNWYVGLLEHSGGLGLPANIPADGKKVSIEGSVLLGFQLVHSLLTVS